jgi:outer membrane immunogenic protein
MRHLLAVAISVFALTEIASAADLPRKAPPYTPPPPPAPTLSWTGWYVGLNAGGIWSNNFNFDNTASSCNLILPGCTPTGISIALAAAVPLSFDVGNKASFIGGGQFGYNYQTGALVWGLETDIQGTNLRGSASTLNTVPVVGGGLISSATVSAAANAHLNVFGTLRGRLGWSPSPPWLLYATGGLAYGHVETDVAFASTLDGCIAVCNANNLTSASYDKWRAGWTAGGGAEWMFAPRWSAKLEYLYYDLGKVTLNTLLDQRGSGIPVALIAISSEAHIRGSIARVGVNYHF